MLPVVEEEEGKAKPPETRVILEAEATRKLDEPFLKCPSCKKKTMNLNFETATIASSTYLSCNSCTFVQESDAPAPAKLSQYTDERERMTDYTLNCLFVLATIANGSGAHEASHLLGFLGLPNDTTMEPRGFGIIEERMAPAIWRVYNEILFENLTEEVKKVWTRMIFVVATFDFIRE
jgi:hypothetical protein